MCIFPGQRILHTVVESREMFIRKSQLVLSSNMELGQTERCLKEHFTVRCLSHVLREYKLFACMQKYSEPLADIEPAISALWSNYRHHPSFTCRTLWDFIKEILCIREAFDEFHFKFYFIFIFVLCE